MSHGVARKNRIGGCTVREKNKNGTCVAYQSLLMLLQSEAERVQKEIKVVLVVF